MNTKIKTNKEIIEEISKIVEPYMKFNMDDIYGDRGGIPYPQIEKLDILHFKYHSRHNPISKQKENELIGKIKSLCIGEVNTYTINGIGKFMEVKLDKYYNRIINEYNNYLDYKNENVEKINNIYQYLEEKVPEEFVGWILFNSR